MVRISRVTEASTAPLFIRIATNRVARVLNIPGPMNSIEIPGDRITQLEIPQAFLYGIRIVVDDEEYRLSQIREIHRFPRVDAIIIFDGFIYGGQGPYAVLPGYTYRPQFVYGGELVESGKSYIYPGQVVGPAAFPRYLPPPYPPCAGGWNPYR